ncbi:MAG: hypothetical protein ACRCVT_02570 [Leadbetterella sp.]
MKLFKCALIFSLLISCGNYEHKWVKNTEIQQGRGVSIVKDSTILYDLENVSSEGAEAIVKYVNNKIKESTVLIYGETRQAKVIYTFTPGLIKVSETEFVYNKELAKVSSEEDMKVKREFTYTIDFNGNIIGNNDKEKVEIFKEFKKVVPFEIR